METEPFFSIITVSLNSGERLFWTLNSFLSQNFFDVEWILKDGRSSDGSIERLNERLENIELPFRHIVEISNDCGIYDAMNQAIDRASGKYLLFLNCGDCFADPFVLLHTKNFIENNGEQAGLYYGDMVLKSSGVTVSANPKITEFSLYKNQPCHQSVFYANTCFDNKKYDVSLKVRADHEHMLYCKKVQNIPYFYMGFSVCIFEGGGLSDDPGLRKLQKKELKLIARRHFGKAKALFFAFLMWATLSPIRNLIAHSSCFGNLYEGLKRKLYMLRG